MIKFLLLLLFASTLFADLPPAYKEHFSNVTTEIPSIHFTMRYAGHNNFVGTAIDGYHASICYLSRPSADALKKVQEDLLKKGMRLKVFDCYRPQHAVNHFVRWAKELNDTTMKSRYYPHVQKRDLFREGYIAAKSGHSRGSTIDLTIEGLDMGSPFDFFDPLSHTMSSKVTKKQHQNRMYLKKVMEAHGFKNYSAEWWHYTLKNEPFFNTYFDFAIE